MHLSLPPPEPPFWALQDWFLTTRDRGLWPLPHNHNLMTLHPLYTKPASWPSPLCLCHSRGATTNTAQGKGASPLYNPAPKGSTSFTEDTSHDLGN